jgi:hypothetical protein
MSFNWLSRYFSVNKSLAARNIFQADGLTCSFSINNYYKLINFELTKSIYISLIKQYWRLGSISLMHFMEWLMFITEDPKQSSLSTKQQSQLIYIDWLIDWLIIALTSSEHYFSCIKHKNNFNNYKEGN